MTEAETFSLMMDDLAAELGTELRFGADGSKWIVPLQDGAIALDVTYRAATGYVIVWAQVDALAAVEDGGDDDYREALYRTLLATTAFGAQTHGFTLAVDPDTRDLVALGRRPARRIADLSDLANWLADLGNLVRDLRLVLTDIESTVALGGEGNDGAADGAGEVRT